MLLRCGKRAIKMATRERSLITVSVNYPITWHSPHSCFQISAQIPLFGFAHFLKLAASATCRAPQFSWWRNSLMMQLRRGVEMQNRFIGQFLLATGLCSRSFVKTAAQNKSLLLHISLSHTHLFSSRLFVSNQQAGCIVSYFQNDWKQIRFSRLNPCFTSDLWIVPSSGWGQMEGKSN